MKILLLPRLCLKEMQPVPVEEDMEFLQYFMDMGASVRRCICKPLSGKRIMEQPGLPIGEMTSVWVVMNVGSLLVTRRRR